MFDSNEIFTGFMHLIDKENDVVFAKKIDRGVVDEKLFFDKAFKNKTTTNKMIEDCVTYLVYNYIDWYKITSSGIEKSSTQLVSVNYEATCYTYFLPGGGEPTGGGTGGNGDATVYDCGDPVHGCINKVKNMLDDCGDGFVKDENGICAPEQIINNLTGKADCVYKKMVDNNNNINWILKNFQDGNTPSQFNLILQMSTSLDNLTNASTIKYGNTFIVSINQYRTENINTTLTIARTILHEGIHARLREFASRMGSNEINFPGVYDFFRRYKGNWDHQQMATYYRNIIAEGLKQYDNAQHSDSFYDALAWEGLSEIRDANNNQELIYTEAWNKLTLAEQAVVLNTITSEKQYGNKTCQ